MAEHIIEEKKKLRKKMLAERDRIIPEVRSQKSAIISQRVIALSGFTSAKNILCFASYGSEVDTKDIIEVSLSSDKAVYLPKICTDEKKSAKVMRFFRIESTDELVKGFKGIMEPAGDEKKEYRLSSDTLVIVPGLAFEKSGARLGYGGGFYDRFIAGVSDGHADGNMLLCGIAFSEQIVDEGSIPVDDRDMRVGILITDR